jgi:mono/diheme cytochrome c family protein
MCGQCHTPRDEAGNLILSQWLHGAPVPVQDPYATKQWATFAPRIAGLPQYSDEQALTLLTKGISRTGNPLRGPMPPFRMSDDDARDVIAYLRSLE